MRELHLRVLFCHFLDRRAPQHAGHEHVLLIHRAQLLAALLRCLKADMGDAHDLVFRVDARVNGAVAVVLFGESEVHPTSELAHDKNIQTAFEQLRLEAGRGHQGGVADRRAQIGVEA